MYPESPLSIASLFSLSHSLFSPLVMLLFLVAPVLDYVIRRMLLENIMTFLPSAMTS
jgi:hypothetical protein